MQIQFAAKKCGFINSSGCMRIALLWTKRTDYAVRSFP